MLRMEKVMRQMPDLVDRQRDQIDLLRRVVDEGYTALMDWRRDAAAAEDRLRAAMAGTQVSYALALDEPIDEPQSTDAAPAPLVIAADGSSIDPDRFAPVQCYLINVGWVVLPYGVDVECRLDSTPLMGPLVEGEEPRPRQQHGAPSPLVGVSLRRDVGELVRASELAEELAGACPTTVLLDGTLLPWELDSPRVPEALRQTLRADTIAALDRLQQAARPLTAGAYISRSSASDVVRSLSALDPRFQPPWNLTDGVLFRGILRENGQRSALFQVASGGESIVESDQDLPGAHHVCFFYFRAGDDIARVEIPRWVADDPACVDLLQATLIDQCRRCDDYPRALQEAHEQAVISGGDREMFRRMLDGEASRAGYRYPYGGKATSKQRRAL